MANFRKACSRMYSAVLVKDAGFNGVNVAAHELGHL